MGNASSRDKKARRRKQEQVMSTGPPPQQGPDGGGGGRGGGQPQSQYIGYDPSAPPQHPHDPRVAGFRRDVRLLPEVNMRRSPASSMAEEDQQYQRPFTYTPQQPQALQQRRPQTAVEKPARADNKNKHKDKPRGKENMMVRQEDLPGYSILPLKQGFEPPPERPPPEDGVLKSGTARRDFRRRLEHQLEQPRRLSPNPAPHSVSLEDYARREDPRGPQARPPPEQLRSLLPWSYLAPPEDLPPRHARPDNDADMEMPPVPVPDYTLHFGQRSRDPLPSPSPDSSTSGYAGERTHGAGTRHNGMLY